MIIQELNITSLGLIKCKNLKKILKSGDIYIFSKIGIGIFFTFFFFRTRTFLVE